MKNYRLSHPLISKDSLREKYGMVIFLFLLFEFVLMISEQTLDPWLLTHYLITYEFGLVPRGFIGSLLSLFANNITYNLVYAVSIVSFTFLIAQISLLLGNAIKTSETDMKPSIKIFALLFLASPFSVTYLLGGYFGRFDLYWVIITLLSLVFLKKPAFRWAVPLLCAVAVMIHQGFMVTYMPALAIALLYEVCRNKYSKSSIAVFALSCFSMISVFLYLQYSVNHIPFDNPVEFLNHLAKRAAFAPEIALIYSEYFCSAKDWSQNVILPTLSIIGPTVVSLMLVFSAPLLIIFFYIWKQSFKTAESKFLKFVFFLCAAAPCIFAAAALFAADLDRWWAAVMNNQFIFIFYFIFSKEKPVTNAVKRVGNFLHHHLLILSLMLIFTNSLTFSKASSLVLNISLDDFRKGGELIMIIVRYVAENIPGIERVFGINV
ncbi:MAG TPA: hypothetical protein PL044_03790 [Clostridiales bacterium]|nr:hypothetical protein [Clostridiales bacterium]HQH63509.1 hypothetical protein [Clostridiales bacterium]HQK72881.1 hypothetical protein [Clostridiales bacterium]